jgi:hypothetical protein
MFLCKVETLTIEIDDDPKKLLKLTYEDVNGPKILEVND